MTEVVVPYWEGKPVRIRNGRILALALLLLCTSSLFGFLLLPLDTILKALAFSLGLVGTLIGIALLHISVTCGYVKVKGDAIEMSMMQNGRAMQRWRLSDIVQIKFEPSKLSLLFVLDNQPSLLRSLRGFKIPAASAPEVAGLVLFAQRKTGKEEDVSIKEWLLGRLGRLSGGQALITLSFRDDKHGKK